MNDKKIEKMKYRLKKLKEEIAAQDVPAEKSMGSINELERELVDTANQSREEGEGRIVTKMEEYFFHIALDKLEDQGRYDFAHKLFYELNTSFREVSSGLCREYIHLQSGQYVTVSLSDIIKYGNEVVWKELGILELVNRNQL